MFKVSKQYYDDFRALLPKQHMKSTEEIRNKNVGRLEHNKLENIKSHAVKLILALTEQR